MRFEWDERTNESNLKKHIVDSKTASLVFLDPWFVMEEDWTQDPPPVGGRFGEVDGEALLLVIHLLADDEEGSELVRIISAREANPQERKRYEGHL